MKNQKSLNRKKIKKAVVRLARRAQISMSEARSVIHFGDNLRHVRTLLNWFKVVPPPPEGKKFDIGFVLVGKDSVLYIQTEVVFTFTETYSPAFGELMKSWTEGLLDPGILSAEIS